MHMYTKTNNIDTSDNIDYIATRNKWKKKRIQFLNSMQSFQIHIFFCLLLFLYVVVFTHTQMQKRACPYNIFFSIT